MSYAASATTVAASKTPRAPGAAGRITEKPTAARISTTRHERQLEVEGERQQPERHARQDPAHGGEDEGRQCELRVSQRDEPATQARPDVLDPLVVPERKPPEQPVERVERPIAVDGEQERRTAEHQRKRQRDRRGCADPVDVREPRKRREQEQQEAEDVEDSLERDRRGGFDRRRSRSPVERDHARRLAGPERQQAVDREADDRRGGGRAVGRTRLPLEEQLPAQGPDGDGDGEDTRTTGRPTRCSPAEARPRPRPGARRGSPGSRSRCVEASATAQMRARRMCVSGGGAPAPTPRAAQQRARAAGRGTRPRRPGCGGSALSPSARRLPRRRVPARPLARARGSASG